MTIDERLAQLKPGDSLKWQGAWGQRFGCYRDHVDDQVVVLEDGRRVLFIIAAADILWPPAPTATPGVVYQRGTPTRDVQRIGTHDGRLWNPGYALPFIPYTPDWLPVDPQEGPKP